VNGAITTEPFAGHFVSAPWRSSGKSLISIGLARIATRRSLEVQTFKKGPDYIDPLWLKAASSAACYNIDPYLQSEDELRDLYLQHVKKVVIVEGTMGLHDGLAVDGSDSNAAIARKLGLPVLLVIDCRGMHRTIAALINGLAQFDPTIDFSGVILNRVRSDRHVSKIEKAITQYCEIPVVGVVAENDALHIDEKELGLVPAPDHPAANNHIEAAADALEASCDIDSLLQLNLSRNQSSSPKPKLVGRINSSYRIGIAQDEAFHFYYEDDLNVLRSRGAELVPFSPMRDSLPAELDGVLIGGGFPERHAEALANNVICREELANRVADGLTVRAECGGLMYLCQSMEYEHVVWPMVGVIPGTVSMMKSPQGRGYMQLKRTNVNPTQCPSTAQMPAHEFHHSSIVFQSSPQCLYTVERGHGLDGLHDGVSVKNVTASYAHFRHTVATPWVDWFLASIQAAKSASNKAKHHV